MKMHEIIRSRRRELGLTQEQVAASLGVTGTAVSKWERGAALPDVSLLPALARLLQTDLNALFSFREELTTQEIADFTRELAPLLTPDCADFDALCEKALEKVREYPTCDALVLNVGVLLNAAVLHCDSENRSRYEAEAVALLNRAAESSNAEIRAQATVLLAARAINAANYDFARSLIDALPDHHPSRQQLEVTLLTRQEKFDAAEELLQRQLLRHTFDVYATLTSLSELALKQNDVPRARHIAGILTELTPLLGLWDFSASAVHLLVSAAAEDADAALPALEAMISALSTAAPPQSTALYSRILPPKNDARHLESLRAQLLSALERDNSFDFLRSEPEFDKLLETLRKTPS